MASWDRVYEKALATPEGDAGLVSLEPRRLSPKPLNPKPFTLLYKVLSEEKTVGAPSPGFSPKPQVLNPNCQGDSCVYSQATLNLN